MGRDGSVERTWEDRGEITISNWESQDITHVLKMDSSQLWLGEVNGEKKIQLGGDSIRLDGTDDVFSFMSSTNVAFYKGNQDVPVASLNASSEPSLVLINTGKGAVRLSTNVGGSNGPTLRLSDSNFRERLVLGRISLRNPRTGSTEIRALSSIVLFDEEGNAVWSAP